MKRYQVNADLMTPQYASPSDIERVIKHYYITHTDACGERYQLTGTWEANTPDAAIAQLLYETGEPDDGSWAAHEMQP